MVGWAIVSETNCSDYMVDSGRSCRKLLHCCPPSRWIAVVSPDGNSRCAGCVNMACRAGCLRIPADSEKNLENLIRWRPGRGLQLWCCWSVSICQETLRNLICQAEELISARRRDWKAAQSRCLKPEIQSMSLRAWLGHTRSRCCSLAGHLWVEDSYMGSTHWRVCLGSQHQSEMESFNFKPLWVGGCGWFV